MSLQKCTKSNIINNLKKNIKFVAINKLNNRNKIHDKIMKLTMCPFAPFG